MTRTIRTNSLTHAEADAHATSLPRLSGKASFGSSNPPFKSKKNGAGRGNWGREGDELVDVVDEYNFQPQIQQRRRSNSNGGNGLFKQPAWAQNSSKFDNLEEEVFYEDED
ncbi:uncharacterized protein V2V93DRAFT_368706 [Kockiozyma suomiensis]|uniref:uncharacterized protein n=1 Tax=Kockiozyma suomiensis TaxID=1337062 RepID=UPI003343035F